VSGRAWQRRVVGETKMGVNTLSFFFFLQLTQNSTVIQMTMDINLQTHGEKFIFFVTMHAYAIWKKRDKNARKFSIIYGQLNGVAARQ